jgi:DNA-binding HxlR family transcriptional regulator
MISIKKAPAGNHAHPGRANPVVGCPLTAALAAIGGKWKLIIEVIVVVTVRLRDVNRVGLATIS